MNIFISIIVFILGLALVICIHEAGHLSMAKVFKVYCEEFSIGFGPRILSINPQDKTTGKKRWETTLNIRCLPFGGYVSMVGEDDDAAFTEAGQQPIPKERTFSGVNRGKQAIIMIAGIVMNVILSYFLFLFGNLFGTQQDLYTDLVRVASDGNIAQVIHMESRDRVAGMVIDFGTLKLDENGIPTSDSTLRVVDGNGDEISNETYQALYQAGLFDTYYTIDGEETANPNNPVRTAGDTSYIGDFPEAYFSYDSYSYTNLSSCLNITFYAPNQENSSFSPIKVVQDSATGYSFLDDGDDSTVALRLAPTAPTEDGEATSAISITFDYIPKSNRLSDYITSDQGTFTIDDKVEGGEVSYYTDEDGNIHYVETAQLSSEIAATEDEETGEITYTSSFGSIGVGAAFTYMPDNDSGVAGSATITWDTVGKAFVQSFVDQGEGIVSVYTALGSLFTAAGWNNVGGIVSIFMTSSEAVGLGFYYVMWVWGLISVNLAVLNLLPIPGLDGWQLLLCIIEAIRRKPISSKFKSYASIVGVSLLLILAVVLVILDCIRYFA